MAALQKSIAKLQSHTINLLGIEGCNFVDLDRDGLIDIGGIFIWAYLQTRNLWIAVGLHALANAPTPMFADDYNAHGLAQDLTIFILLVQLAAVVLFRWARPTYTA